MNISSKSVRTIDKKSLYWICQITGWGIVAIYWAYVVFSRDGYSVFQTFLNYFFDILIGIFLTHMYRAFAIKSKWIELPIQKLLTRIVASVVILAFLYALICNVKWYFFWSTIKDSSISFTEAILYWDPILITGFRLMSIWILAYHLYHYYQKEVVTARKNAQLSLLVTQTQLDNLSAQLNPHFLFNSLNSIKSLVEENPSKARRAIDLLSDLLRSSLYEKEKDLISIKNELSLVNDYIELEKMRFEERLQLELTVDESLYNFKIPTLSIQLLVENAIKHGIDTKIEGGVISVIINKENGSVSIQVQNPGVLSINETTKGLGLKNLQERLKIQYKGTASFDLIALNKDVVEAKILIPFTADENL